MLVRRKITELTDNDLIEIFSNVQYEDIPAEFIAGAKLMNQNGTCSYFTGEEFKDFMMKIKQTNNIVPYGEFELSLNVDRFSKNVNSITKEILDKAIRNDKSNSSN